MARPATKELISESQLWPDRVERDAIPGPPAPGADAIPLDQQRGVLSTRVRACVLDLCVHVNLSVCMCI